MTLDTTLQNAQGGAMLKNFATAFGVDPQKAEQAVSVMTAALSDRIERNTLSRGGLADVVDLLTRSDSSRILSDPRSLASPQTEAAGNHILDVLIGDKHISRGIAHRAARQSGLDEAVLKKMLPAVAEAMIGGLQKETEGIFADRLKGVQGLRPAGGSPLSLPGEDMPPVDAGRPAPRFPQPGGSAGMGGTVGGSPLPIPGDTIPGVGRDSRGGGGGGFENLPDIIRRGGTQVPGGGDLGDVIRSILGSLLGFQPRGVLGWIMALIFSRWFRGIIGGILRRIFMGR